MQRLRWRLVLFGALPSGLLALLFMLMAAATRDLWWYLGVAVAALIFFGVLGYGLAADRAHEAHTRRR